MKRKLTSDPKKEGIPASLQVQNRQPLTPEQQEKVDAIKKAAIEAAYDPQLWDKPKGMTMAEYETWKSKERTEHEQSIRSNKLKTIGTPPILKRKTVSPRSTRSREGMITVASIAEELKLLPREARAILRSSKIAKPDCGWAYKPDDPALESVRAALKAGPVKGVKKPRGKRAMSKDKIAAEAKEIKESGAVFTSKAKVTRTKSPPPEPTPTKREKLLKDLKQSIKDMKGKRK